MAAGWAARAMAAAGWVVVAMVEGSAEEERVAVMVVEALVDLAVRGWVAADSEVVALAAVAVQVGLAVVDSVVAAMGEAD